MNNIFVLSLGGSILAKDTIDVSYLKKLRTLLSKHKTKKFVIVVGGGKPSRIYTTAMKKAGGDIDECSRVGATVTQLNAQVVWQVFKKNVNKKTPKSMREIYDLLKKHNIVIDLKPRFEQGITSDAVAVQAAKYLKATFINITNVKGLHTSDPKRNKNAKLVSKISSKEIEKLAKKIDYKPGQHFVIDQKAATLIRKHAIPSYIVGESIKNLDNLLQNKKFVGTIIT